MSDALPPVLAWVLRETGNLVGDTDVLASWIEQFTSQAVGFRNTHVSLSPPYVAMEWLRLGSRMIFNANMNNSAWTLRRDDVQLAAGKGALTPDALGAVTWFSKVHSSEADVTAARADLEIIDQRYSVHVGDDEHYALRRCSGVTTLRLDDPLVT